MHPLLVAVRRSPGAKIGDLGELGVEALEALCSPVELEPLDTPASDFDDHGRILRTLPEADLDPVIMSLSCKDRTETTAPEIGDDGVEHSKDMENARPPDTLGKIVSVRILREHAVIERQAPLPSGKRSGPPDADPRPWAASPRLSPRFSPRSPL